MKLLALLKVKALVTIVTGLVLVGGATAAFAATPAGQTVVQSLTHAHPTASAEATPAATKDAQNGANTHDKGQQTCSGLSDAQHLATSYHLSTGSQGNAVQAICALHQKTFKSATTSGATVTISRVYGYGEIDQLLTYAQYLAAHDSGNADGKLTDTNVSSYLANALQSCGTTPLEKCLQTNIPGYHPGNGSAPTSTPTPNSGKPTGTPTPNGKKPTATPTPHH